MAFQNHCTVCKKESGIQWEKQHWGVLPLEQNVNSSFWPLFYLETTRGWLCNHELLNRVHSCRHVSLRYTRGLSKALLQIICPRAKMIFYFFYELFIFKEWLIFTAVLLFLFILFGTKIHLTFLLDLCLFLSWEMSLQEVTIKRWIRWEFLFPLFLKSNNDYRNKVITICTVTQS